jgi:alkanesulfonate monooxygenase SsuD/methylene tetrahydromethanopterin reductase-like flavin-dependent oxidoreductase (luciferase family)
MTRPTPHPEVAMDRFKVGAQFHPQHASLDEQRRAWREAEALGVDTIWNWDHFFPLYGEPDGRTSKAGSSWPPWRARRTESGSDPS